MNNLRFYIENLEFNKAIECLQKSNMKDEQTLLLFFKQKNKPDINVIKTIENILFKSEEKYNDIYFEIGKYYLDVDKNKAMTYIERYINLGNKDRDKYFLLIKLFFENNYTDKAYSGLIDMGCETDEELKEMIKIVTSGNRNINDIKEGLNIVLGRENDDITEFLLKEILSKKILIEGKYHRDNSKDWVCFVENSVDKIKNKSDIYKSLALYYKSKKQIEFALKNFRKTLEIEDCEARTVCYMILEMLETIEIKDKQFVIEELLKLSEINKDIKLKNIFLNEAEILQKKTILKSRPRQMQVLLTTKCNLKCIMCSVRKGNYEISEKVLAFLKEQIPYLERILWQGGEVFLYKNFCELLDLAGRHNVVQGFITNGLLLDDKNIDLILKYNISLSVSIDAVTKEIYEKIRFGGKFESLIKVLEKLNKKRKENKQFSYVMATVIMNDNYKQVEQMVNFALKYGFKEIWFQLVRGNPQMSLNKDQEYEFFNFIRKAKNNEIEIHTNTNYKAYFLGQKKEVKHEDTYSACNAKNTNVSKTDNVQNIDNIQNIFNKNLICLAPWKTMFFDIGGTYKNSCYCHQYDIYDENLDFWNSNPIIKARKNIINEYLLPECVECFNLGDCGNKNRLGLL